MSFLHIWAIESNWIRWVCDNSKVTALLLPGAGFFKTLTWINIINAVYHFNNLSDARALFWPAPCGTLGFDLFFFFSPLVRESRIGSEKCMWHKWQSATLINKIVGLLPTDSNNMHGTNNRNEQTKCDLGSGRKKKRKTNLFTVCCLVFTVCWQTELCQHFSLCAKMATERERAIVVLNLASFFQGVTWVDSHRNVITAQIAYFN